MILFNFIQQSLRIRIVIGWKTSKIGVYLVSCGGASAYQPIIMGNQYVVAENAEEALKLAQAQKPDTRMDDLRQDEDVLDTWFSSWLWPMSVFDGIKNPDNPEITYYYPTNDLVTAPEILFFWVARMIMVTNAKGHFLLRTCT